MVSCLPLPLLLCIVPAPGAYSSSELQAKSARNDPDSHVSLLKLGEYGVISEFRQSVRDLKARSEIPVVRRHTSDGQAYPNYRIWFYYEFSNVTDMIFDIKNEWAKRRRMQLLLRGR